MIVSKSLILPGRVTFQVSEGEVAWEVGLKFDGWCSCGLDWSFADLGAIGNEKGYSS